MIRIGIVSDTHSFADPKIINFFSDCQEIWHAGDIGNLQTAKEYSKNKLFRAVYGNIDGQDVRLVYPEHNRFMCEEVDVWITHIGGYPGKYDRKIKQEIQLNPPKLFICGHSHILKVIYDKNLETLCINPGAGGNNGWHTLKTAIKLDINKHEISNLQIIEIPRNTNI